MKLPAIQKILLLLVAIIIAAIIFVGISSRGSKDSIQTQQVQDTTIISNQNIVIINNVSQDSIQTSVQNPDIIKNQKTIIENQNAMIKNQNTMIKNDDTLKKNTLEAKTAEYMEWQERSRKIDRNFEKMDKQNAIMDSLLIAKPKQIKKNPQ